MRPPVPPSPPARVPRQTLLFRADASATIGAGHLMRCLALAEIAIEHGYRAVFAVAGCPASLAARLMDAGIGLYRLEQPADIAEWGALVMRVDPFAVVIDGYRFSARYRRVASDAGYPLIAIDDAVGQDPPAADILLNPAPTATTAMYPDLPAGRLFLGPRYAPLRAEFRKPTRCPGGNDQRDRLLLTLGGSDPLALTLPLLTRLRTALPDDTPIDAVAGGLAPTDYSLPTDDPTTPVQLHQDVRRMAPLMQRALVAVSAAGSTLWELACMQVPTVALVVADNQAGALREPMCRWFRVIDARVNPQQVLPAIAASVQALWQDGRQRAGYAATLASIGVGARVGELFEAIDQLRRA